MKLIILDRDGVINIDSALYIKSPAEWKALPGSLEAIARLNQAGYKVVVATNQSGIGRGLFDMDTLNAMHEKMHKGLAAVGGRVDAIFYCPHTADENCNCRKPKPGMFERIATIYNQDLTGVPAIGDSLRDLQAASALGCAPILVRTGKGEKTEAEGNLPPGTVVRADLAAAVDALLGKPSKKMSRPVTALRSALFTLLLSVWTIFCGTLVLCTYVLPESPRFKSCYAVCQMWRYGFMTMCYVILGLRTQIQGREHISAEPAIYLAKHQSAWETIALQIWTPPAIFVLKRELLRIPFFGWALWGLRMIWIDRSAGKAALEKIVTQGQKRLAQGLSIIIFPEGTRVAPGQMGKFKAGGARLAVRTGAPVIPVAHNAGELWPRNAFIKKSGTITVRFGPAIDPTGLTDSELNDRVETWIREAMRELPPVRQ